MAPGNGRSGVPGQSGEAVCGVIATASEAWREAIFSQARTLERDCRVASLLAMTEGWVAVALPPFTRLPCQVCQTGLTIGCTTAHDDRWIWRLPDLSGTGAIVTSAGSTASARRDRGTVSRAACRVPGPRAFGGRGTVQGDR